MSDNLAADKDWEDAEFRARVLAELPEQLTEGDVTWAMRLLGVSRATVYRLARQFREDARTSALLPNTSGRKPGMLPLDPAVEAIVVHHFKGFYATRRKPTKTRFWREVATDCKAKGLTPPSIRRLGRWLDLKDQAKLIARREGKDKADRRHLATPGTLTAAHPLDIVQIDHTKADVTVVDPVTRRPLGRPTLTVAIDVNSRMILGFHLSLEPPSLLSVALCLTHAVMDKSHWLAARGINTDWPGHGIPKAIYVDNGAEFHARAFGLACAEYQIDLRYRPPGTPRYGGHIERLIGTMMGAIHLLPGSHFSNIFERGDLDAEAEAVMTLAELETWLALEITGSYHARIHSALETTPSAAWGLCAGEPKLRMPADLRQFLVDFLPSEQRVLQRDGFHLFHIRYWSNELRWLMARESRKYTLKYDPRDLSRIFVLTEEGIIEARPADLTRPAITLWEHRAARRALRESGRRSVDEELIFRTIEAQRDLVDSAARQTKAIRRHQARRAHLDPRPMIDVTPASEPPAARPASENKSNALKDHPGFYVEEWYDDD
ncbi:Mu transposase C-terminal domain-containing protein [Sulfitobacter pontiacus]|uniref:Mu transposase C-terminal domain-containing protein n=1 Tax=Sulfitobacter pontiacus TaxID=60137 RepID=UPI00258D696B|nr:Mu transposase C-terminal domain-containing protein [uncultured Sulfitobacter sp.]|tara:strand:- start:20786 stop:22432 length:1647 start_codon:yes stop_codon:yes gene_type:complete